MREFTFCLSPESVLQITVQIDKTLASRHVVLPYRTGNKQVWGMALYFFICCSASSDSQQFARENGIFTKSNGMTCLSSWSLLFIFVNLLIAQEMILPNPTDNVVKTSLEQIQLLTQDGALSGCQCRLLFLFYNFFNPGCSNKDL